jgi:hypothetical protein
MSSIWSWSTEGTSGDIFKLNFMLLIQQVKLIEINFFIYLKKKMDKAYPGVSGIR